MRPNKGIEQLLSAFAALPDERTRLVIAGAPGPATEYVEGLRASAAQDARVLFRAEWIPEERVQGYFAAADVAVTSFARVLTSGSVMLALSFGKPVIAPAAGCLPEVVPPDAGWLYDEHDPSGLLAALKAALRCDLAVAGGRAQQAAEEATWQEAARVTLWAYGMVPGTDHSVSAHA
jgi:glycosyltransferase involved in cell wall biosynthesis